MNIYYTTIENSDLVAQRNRGMRYRYMIIKI